MSLSSKIFKLLDDRSVRTHIPGFHVPDFSKERYDADPLTAHLAIKFLRDTIDGDHCAYLFDKHHDLPDISYLKDLQDRDTSRRKIEIMAFQAIHQRWEHTMQVLSLDWVQQGYPIHSMAEGLEKITALQAHNDLQAAIIANHPEPKPTKFDPQILSTEATLLAAREIEDKRRKDDADK